MSSGPNGVRVAEPPAPGSPEALQRRVEVQRERLADTVDALHHRLDLKAQAKARAARLKESATTHHGRPAPVLLAGAGSLVVAGALLWWRRRT